MSLVLGTLVQTPTGLVAVETLRPGDCIVALGGAVREVRWIGERMLFARFIRPEDVPALIPVGIPAGALGPEQPVHDLVVSPCQLVRFGNMLVPAGRLLGCGGIAQVFPPGNPSNPMDNAVRYYDVELFGHDVMYAAGAPVASYLCRGDRNKFRNVVDFFQRYGADRTEPEPRFPVVASGPRIDALRVNLGGPARVKPSFKGARVWVSPASMKRSAAPGTAALPITQASRLSPSLH